MKSIKSIIIFLLIAAMVFPTALAEEMPELLPKEEVQSEESYEVKEAPASESEPAPAPEPPPAPAPEQKPAEEIKPAEETKPVEEKSAVEEQPTAEQKPSEEEKVKTEDKEDSDSSVNEEKNNQETIETKNETTSGDGTTDTDSKSDEDSSAGIETEINNEESKKEPTEDSNNSEEMGNDENSSANENEGDGTNEGITDPTEGEQKEEITEDPEDELKEYSIVMTQDGNPVKSSYMYTNENDAITFNWSLNDGKGTVNEATFVLTIVNEKGEEQGPYNVNSCSITASQFKGTNKFKIDAYLGGENVCKTERSITFTPEANQKMYVGYHIQVLCDGSTIQSPYGADNPNGVYSVTWQLYGDTNEGSEVVENASYSVTITKADGSIEGPMNGTVFSFIAANYPGKNLISVEAQLNGEQICNITAEIEFATMPSPSPQPTKPSNMKGFSGGGKPSGSMSGGTSSISIEQPGIVAGESLIDTHASGNKNMTLYTDVEPVMEDTGIHFENTGADIRLNRGIYTVETGEDEIKLDSVTDGNEWTFTGLSLKTLEKAGITELKLGIGKKEICLHTNAELKGYYYGKLRSQGLVSADFIYSVTENGVIISVKDDDYTVDENGELQPV